MIFSEVKKVSEVIQKLNEVGIDSSRFSFDDLSIIGDDLDNKVGKISEVIQKLNELGVDDSKFSFDNLSLIGDGISGDEGFLEKFKQALEDVREVANGLSEDSDEEGGVLGSLTESLDTDTIELFQASITDLEPQQQALILSTQGLSAAQIQQTLTTNNLSNAQAYQAMTEAGLLKSKVTLTGVESKQLVTTLMTAEAIDLETAKELGLVAANGAALSGKVKLTGATLAQMLESRKLNQEQAELIATTYGVSIAQKEQVVSIIPAMIAKIKSLTAAIWAQVKATAAWLVTNPTGWAILAASAIGVVIGAYSLFNESAEETAEKVNNLIDEFDSALKTANQNLETIESLSVRYEELSEGVDNLGRNISLSTDEFKEYNNIVNKIADMSPELVKGYTSEGNAILSLKGNVDELKQSYIDAQKEAYNLLKNSDDAIITNYKKQMHKRGVTIFDQETGLKDVIDVLTKLQETSDPEDFIQVYTSLNELYGSYWGTDNIQNALASSGIKDILKNKEFSFSGSLSQITQKDLSEIKRGIQNTIQIYQSEIDSQLQPVKTYANAYLMTNSDYEKLDEQSKNVVSLLVNSIDESIIDTFDSDYDIGTYVSYLVNSISNNDETQKALLDLFSIDFSEMSPVEAKSQIDSLIKTISDTLDEDALELKVRLGFDNYDDLARNYETVLDNAAKRFTDVTDGDLNTNNINNGASAKAYQENLKKYQEEKQVLDDFARKNKINTQDQIAFWNQCIEESEDREQAIERYLKSPFATGDKIFQDIFATEDAKGELNTLGQLSEQLDKIQSAYQTLSDTIEHYNNTGHITIDQFQEIIDQGDDFLDYLTLEDGQLGMNEQAMYDLAEARIVEMKAKMISNIIDNVTSIENETQALSYLESTNYKLADSYEHLAKAKINAWATEMATNGNLSEDQINSVKQKAESDIEKINALAAKIDIKSLGGGSGSGGSDSEYDWKNLLDKEIAVLEKQLDAGLIDFDTYLGKRLDLIEKYYQEGKIKAEDYYEYLEKTYENQLSIYDRVISAVTNKLEKQIEQLEKQKEVIEEGYQLQIDKLNEEIELLEKEYQKKKDLEELEQARYNAEKARNQRTKRLYTGDNFIYTPDDEEVRNAEEELADKELQMNISRLEEQIESLEKEMEEATKHIDEQIEKIQEYIEQWSEVADAYEEAQNEMLASQVLGAQWESEILALRKDVLNQFKNEYIRIQEEMANAALKAAEAQLEAERMLAKGSGSGGSGSGGGNNSGGTSSEKYKYNGKVYNSEQEAKNARDRDVQKLEEELKSVKNPGNTSAFEAQKNAIKEQIRQVKARPITKCAKGGVIKKSDNLFSSIAESIGEDTMVAVRDGERILTPIQNKHFEKLISISDKLVPALLKGNLLNKNLFGNLQNNNIPSVPATANSINISIGDINLHEVNDVNTLSQAIIAQLPNKINQAINRR